MPYIKKEDRERLDMIVDMLSPKFAIYKAENGGTMPPGWINYMISKIIHQYLLEHKVSYTNLNAMIGVLECVKLELYRVIGSIYEDEKIKQNGWISELDSSFNKPDEKC